MRILIIEDEPKIANSIKKGLEIEKFAVDVVFNGMEGLDFAITEEYDAIILDRLLPGMDGITVCKKLREKMCTPPIIMLTAIGDIDEKVNGLNSGADDYLTKPFAFSELIARIRALIRRPKVHTGTELFTQDLQLNPTTFEVMRDEVPISLSGKEFALLEYLLRHKGKVVNKDQIINHVWDYESDVLPNSVEVYMTHLRNKVDRPFTNKPPLIKTVRGFGYKIVEK